MPTILTMLPQNYQRALLAQAPPGYQVCAVPVHVLLSRLREDPPDGVVAFITDPQVRDVLTHCPCPAVNVSCGLDNPGCVRIGPDNTSAAHMGIAHLSQRGFTCIGIIGRKGSRFATQRCATAEHACATRQLTTSRFELNADGSIDAQRARQWHASLPRTHALFAASDKVAHTWLSTLHPATTRPAIIGIDDDEVLCMSTTPQLSSVRWSLVKMAEQTWASLRNQQDGKQVAQEETFPPVGVIIRQSTQDWVTDDPLVSAAIAWIERHATDAITIPHVARVLGCHRRRLERAFHAEFKRGPRWFIENARIEAAKQHLRVSNDLLAVIAETSGFSSASRLIDRFKHVVGVTPHVWRQAVWLGEA